MLRTRTPRRRNCCGNLMRSQCLASFARMSYLITAGMSELRQAGRSMWAVVVMLYHSMLMIRKVNSLISA